jgi:hypothetical protein
MKYIRIILAFCLLAMMSQGVLAWGSLKSNNVSEWGFRPPQTLLDLD